MKVYRLNREESARWKMNRSYIVRDSDEAAIRAMTVEEIQNYDDRVRDGMPTTLMVDGAPCRRVQDREILKSELLQRFGDVSVKHTNGMPLCTLRDPTVERATYNGHIVEMPSPEQCSCASKGEPHPGRHHPLCPNNQRALKQHRALPADYESLGRAAPLELPNERPASAAERAQPLPPGVEVIQAPLPERPAPRALSAHPRTPPVPAVPAGPASPPPSPAIPHPKECVCAGFATPNPDPGNQHNTLCQFYDDWLATHPLKNVYMLIAYGTNQPIREATPDEVRKANSDIGRVLRINSKHYQVLTLSELEALESGSKTADTERPPPLETESELESDSESEPENEKTEVVLSPAILEEPHSPS